MDIRLGWIDNHLTVSRVVDDKVERWNRLSFYYGEGPGRFNCQTYQGYTGHECWFSRNL